MESAPNRKEKLLEEHARLHQLFKENRFAFELERKQAIESTIAGGQTPYSREKLQKTQDRLDHILSHSGSAHNRLVLMQMIFWEHVTKQFFPAVGSVKQNK